VQDVKGGSLDFNLISLFPPTWNNRPNGLRPDLVQALSDLKPVRQCIVASREGPLTTLEIPPVSRR